MSEGAKWQVVAVAAGVALAGFGLVRLLDRAEEPAPVRIGGGAGAGSFGQGTGSSSASGARGMARGGTGAGEGVLIHVAGAVRRPGVYRVPPGARVDLAVRRAGGPTPRADLVAVNLAAPVEDGQQVVVPMRLPGAAGAGSAATRGAGAGVPLNLATVTAEDLEELDGIGETLAERIIEHRDQTGASSAEDLAEIDGIGETRLEALREAFGP